MLLYLSSLPLFGELNPPPRQHHQSLTITITTTSITSSTPLLQTSSVSSTTQSKQYLQNPQRFQCPSYKTNAHRSKPSFFPELRRTKSFSASKGEGFSGVFEPQRKSCDVKVKSTLWTLFNQDDIREGTKMEAPPEIEVPAQNLSCSSSTCVDSYLPVVDFTEIAVAPLHYQLRSQLGDTTAKHSQRLLTVDLS